jgi:hypothetical protein
VRRWSRPSILRRATIAKRPAKIAARHPLLRLAGWHQNVPDLMPIFPYPLSVGKRLPFQKVISRPLSLSIGRTRDAARRAEIHTAWREGFLN